jgi:hypothetical protein
MALTWVNTGGGILTSSFTTWSKLSGITAGDIIILQIWGSDTAPYTGAFATSSHVWTLIRNDDFDSGGRTYLARFYYRIADASDIGGSYTVSWDDVPTEAFFVMSAWQSDLGSDYYIDHDGNDETTATSIQNTEFTPTVDSGVLLGYLRTPTQTSSWVTWPGTMTEQQDTNNDPNGSASHADELVSVGTPIQITVSVSASSFLSLTLLFVSDEEAPPTISAGRVVAGSLNVDWDFDTTYTDETAYQVSGAGSLRLSPPETAIWSPRGIVDRMTAVLKNETGRFSPLNTAGALYADIRDGKLYHAPMYQRISIDGGANYSRVFTGVIKIPQESGSNMQSVAQVTLDCRSKDERLLTRRISTTLADFVHIYNTGFTESDVIGSILISYAGLTVDDLSLDPGLFIIPWAWLDDESPIEACWALAAACGGRFYATPDGRLAYENAQHWLLSPHAASVATLDRSNAQMFRPYYNDTELYQAVTVEAQPRFISESDTLWEADQIPVVPAGTTGSDYVTVWAELGNPAWEINDATYDAASSGGTGLSASVSLVQTNYAQRVELKFQNSHATLAAEIRRLAITGKPVLREDSVELTAVSTDSFWDDRDGRTRKLSGNRWIQTQGQLDFLAEFLRDRHETPRLFWKIDGYRGDPARRLGDRITVDDASVMDASREVFVTAIDWRYDRNTGFRQTGLEAVDATDLYAYGDDPGYFIIGSDVLAGTKRIFY